MSSGRSVISVSETPKPELAVEAETTDLAQPITIRRRRTFRVNSVRAFSSCGGLPGRSRW